MFCSMKSKAITFAHAVVKLGALKNARKWRNLLVYKVSTCGCFMKNGDLTIFNLSKLWISWDIRGIPSSHPIPDGKNRPNRSCKLARGTVFHHHGMTRLPLVHLLPPGPTGVCRAMPNTCSFMPLHCFWFVLPMEDWRFSDFHSLSPCLSPKILYIRIYIYIYIFSTFFPWKKCGGSNWTSHMS